MYKVAPLSSGFMLVSMVGFMVTVVYTSFGKIDPTWGFTLGLFFVIMFVSSMISMTYAPVEALMKQDAEERGNIKKKRAKKK
ncbi:hypothetical protein ACFL96_18595 [Thermoproteota archaeon]